MTGTRRQVVLGVIPLYLRTIIGLLQKEPMRKLGDYLGPVDVWGERRYRERSSALYVASCRRKLKVEALKKSV